MTKKSFFTGLLLAVATCGLDQLSKFAVLRDEQLSNHIGINILPFFNLILVHNHGISFGMLAGQDQRLLLIIMSLAIVGVLLAWLYKNTSLMVAIGIGFVIGGAIGNVIDRVRIGSVVDFLDFYIKDYHWPAFNIADSTIFIGVVVLCAHSMFFENKKPRRDSLI